MDEYFRTYVFKIILFYVKEKDNWMGHNIWEMGRFCKYIIHWLIRIIYVNNIRLLMLIIAEDA